MRVAMLWMPGCAWTMPNTRDGEVSPRDTNREPSVPKGTWRPAPKGWTPKQELPAKK